MERTTANETILDEKQWNIWAIRTGAIVADAINYSKLINAYLKKNEQPLDRCEEYMNKYTKDEFCDLLLQFYDIKGVITPDKILKAKKRSLDGSESEHDIQVKVCKYLTSKGLKYWAVPNGFVHNSSDKMATVRYIGYMKSEGVRNGVFDMTILLGQGDIAFLELKTPKGKPSEEQLKWKEYFDENNYKNAICKGYDEAVAFIDSLIGE